MDHQRFWRPPDFGASSGGLTGEIRARFRDIYPKGRYGDLARRISRYWIDALGLIQASRANALVEKDFDYDTADPLSRIVQKAVVIAYADSVHEGKADSLVVLDDFLSTRFPAVGGLHLLPVCVMAEDRFNDGGFSQIRRDRVHPAFGTNAEFAGLMEKYVSMTDFVLNHVDMEHPAFQRYLAGDDAAGRCFYVFTEAAYRQRLARGDFDSIFRPRPFPLFTIFRRVPPGAAAAMSRDQRVAMLNRRLGEKGLGALPGEVIGLLCCFDKVKNDQMLLADDHADVVAFRHWLQAATSLEPDRIFALSKTQETRHPAYIFVDEIQRAGNLLEMVFPHLGKAPERAGDYAAVFRLFEAEIFGEPIRAMTTFSHVQVDLNTATFEGLTLLMDDFAWYLSMDLNMLRLDAANFAFKEWKTSCFGLPQVRQLMEILYLSMDAVAPRMVPNLEVNAPLSAVLRQMADPESPPPMIYDFHLASMLPVVFNEADARPLEKIAPLVRGFDIPPTSIRFSLDESHDGKSVSGSGGADPLLTYAQRRSLVETVRTNGGRVKYKSAPKGCMDSNEFAKICDESGLNPARAAAALFQSDAKDSPLLILKASVDSFPALAGALGVSPERLRADAALAFLADRLLLGREPYELCVSTRDALTRIDDPNLEVRRYLAFKTLGLALMGRHVKAVYFNDLMGLANDPELVRRTGELRNIKRTRSHGRRLSAVLDDPTRCEHWIARLMNNTIALVDSDPSLSPRGNEAQVIADPSVPAVAWVKNTCQGHCSLAVVNTAGAAVTVSVNAVAPWGHRDRSLWENFSGMPVAFTDSEMGGQLTLEPFDRLWLTPQPIRVPQALLVPVGTAGEMAQRLSPQV